MPTTELVRVDDLQPGDRLGRDVMVNHMIMLNRGTVLTETHISRIRRLGLEEVLIELPDPEDPRVELVPTRLDVEALASPEHPTWMAQASFSEPVPLPELTAAEQLLSASSAEIRAEAGLVPCIDPRREAELTKGVHATFITSAVKGEVDLARLTELATQLFDEFRVAESRYIGFRDVQEYGQALAARSIQSAKVYDFAGFGNGEYPMPDQLGCHLALANAFALMPADQPAAELTGSWRDKQLVKQALQNYYSWLSARKFADPKVLEPMLARFERHDGSGVPQGLSGDQIPPLSQNWSLAWQYCGQLLSQPGKGRASPHQAAVGQVQQSGRAFSGAAVNGFLRRIGYYPVGSLVELSDTRLGIVVQQNHEALLKPVVRVVDSDGRVGKPLDLQREGSMFISSQVLEY